MLQANPDLNVEEVRNILMETANRDIYVTTTGNPVQWGAGKIDVLNAVKKAVELGAGVENIVADNADKLFVTPVGQNQYNVTVLGAADVQVALCNMAGQIVENASAQGETVAVDASTVAIGVYVLVVEADGVKYTSKIVVK
jgi:hypothetical protein